MRKFIVARKDQLSVGERMLVTINKHSIGVFCEHDGYYALLNRCPHQGAELCKGDLVGMLESSEPGDVRFDPSRKLLACPWHGWEFDIKTGKSYLDPVRTRVRRYLVEVERGTEIGDVVEGPAGLVEGPYTAEVFPVSIEDDYLVVLMP
jgi:nitrite reductase/ring-hydroxylating ferredoxin subunit